MTETSSRDVGATLGGLTQSSEPSDYAKNGFHHRHTAAVDDALAIAKAFFRGGYWLEMLTCEDRRFDDIGKLRLVYCFSRFEELDRHVVFIELEMGQEVDSVVEVYAGADWFEREVFEMFGVVFRGHPNLKQLLLPEDADFNALLKDFGRPEDADKEGEAP